MRGTKSVKSPPKKFVAQLSINDECGDEPCDAAKPEGLVEEASSILRTLEGCLSAANFIENGLLPPAPMDACVKAECHEPSDLQSLLREIAGRAGALHSQLNTLTRVIRG